MTMTPNDADAHPAGPDPLILSRTLQVIGGKWRLHLILVLDEQTLRYSHLRERLPGISEKVLADELKALVALNVITRMSYAQIPPRVEYTLTENGRLALPLLRQFGQIGQFFL